MALHPGTTDTDLSKPFQKNVQKERLFPVDFTVREEHIIIYQRFFDWSIMTGFVVNHIMVLRFIVCWMSLNQWKMNILEAILIGLGKRSHSKLFIEHSEYNSGKTSYFF